MELMRLFFFWFLFMIVTSIAYLVKMYKYIKFPEEDDSSSKSLEEDYIDTANKMLEQIQKYEKFEDCVLFESIPLELLSVSFKLSSLSAAVL